MLAALGILRYVSAAFAITAIWSLISQQWALMTLFWTLAALTLILSRNRRLTRTAALRHIDRQERQPVPAEQEFAHRMAAQLSRATFEMTEDD
ncbi:MAG: hypothetical protein OXD34_11910 [bacterium]|nr:hypothetical protein [bacterium]